jgi:hypothetical protein
MLRGSRAWGLVSQTYDPYVGVTGAHVYGGPGKLPVMEASDVGIRAVPGLAAD